LYCPEPDCGMASWEAQKYFKQLIAGVVSEFLGSLIFYTADQYLYVRVLMMMYNTLSGIIKSTECQKLDFSAFR
jgi:hypothetical protein